MKAITCLTAAAITCVVLPQTAGAAGITYDCDTAAEHFSELVLPTSGTHFSVTGNVQMRKMATFKTYVPLARIQVAQASAPGESSDQTVGFSLVTMPFDKRKTPTGEPVLQVVNFTQAGKEDELETSSLQTKPGSVQPFQLIYDGKNVVVNVNGATRTLALTASQPVVRVICSTGEFLFTDLEIKAAP